MSAVDRPPLDPLGSESISLVLVTGPSGAGRTTALAALEDLGFETISNMPLFVIPALIEGAQRGTPLALGLDVRSRDFGVSRAIELIDRLANDPSVVLDVVFLDARPEVLIARYNETRRRHPLSPDEAPEIGVAAEAKMLDPIRFRANVLIDTSEMTPHQLRAEMTHWFGDQTQSPLTVSVNSFSYKRGVPNGMDVVHDARFLRNPHWEPELRALTGKHPDVAAFVREDPRYTAYLEQLMGLFALTLPGHEQEGRSHVAVGIGCTGGKHRSVALAEDVAARLAEAGWRVSLRHREQERAALAQVSPQEGDRL